MPRLLFPMILLLVFGALACRSAGPARFEKTPPSTMAPAATGEAAWSPILRSADTMTATFEHHGNWIGQNLQFVPFDKLRLQLEKHLGRQLQNRGEAHVTLLTPPEFETLQRCFSMEELESFLDRKSIQDSAYVPECIGKGSLGAPPFRQETYFVVVSSIALAGLRKKLEIAAAAKGCRGFKAAPYYPHVTLGFDQRDLHEADGVLKDQRACAYPIQNP